MQLLDLVPRMNVILETCSLQLQSGTISHTKHKYHEVKLYKNKLERLSRILAAIIFLGTTKVSK